MTKALLSLSARRGGQAGPLSPGPPARVRQRGAALLFLLVLMGIGLSLLVTNVSTDLARSVHSEVRSRAVLAHVSEALIAYSVAHPTKPGALPCPDIDNDGLENPIPNPPGTGPCPSYIGRLPWLTLGIGDIRDQHGERLWYALSPNFRNSSAIQINSDTKGTVTVYSGNNTSTLTIQAAAVIFAPGSVLANQTRDPLVAACATTGTTLARNLCASNYLDTAFTVNNGSGTVNGPYITAPDGLTFNDRLYVVRTSDFIPLVERRVAVELRQTLITYRTESSNGFANGGCDCFPWPDTDRNGTSNVGTNRGRVPVSTTNTVPHNWGFSFPPDPLTGTIYTIPALPPYFVPNNWQSVIYYAVGRQALENRGLAPTACVTCTNDPPLPPPPLLIGTLSIDDKPGNAVVLISLGSAGVSRPSVLWSNYIDDPLNSNADDRFVTPASKAFDRDRLWPIADLVPPVSCTSNARALLKNAPCRTGGGNVKPICASASKSLKDPLCLPQPACGQAANAMVTTPCRNTLNPSQCQAAVKSLQGC